MILPRSAAFLALSLPLATLAQSAAGSRDAVRACAEIESVEARVACIEELFGLQPQPSESADTATLPDQPKDGAAAGPEAARASEPLEAAPAPMPEHRNVRAGQSNALSVWVVEVRTRVPGRAEFLTRSGRRFVQTSGGRRLILPELPFAAELEQAALGGLFLVPPENRPAIRVVERE